ncbi:MAG: hypothetical protein FJZ56_00320 [Chlamydiae bacterium]|nr:hypothetical protein [Chlamydiota bacterium]
MRALFLLLSLLAIKSPLWSSSAFELTVPHEKQKVIKELISTMGTTSTLALGFKKSHLEGLGKELKGVETLQFLAYVFSEPSLQKHMLSIRSSSFKWSGFIKGIAPRLKQELLEEKLLTALPAFASFLKAPHAKLEKAAKEQNWEEFVLALIEARS